jgi:predicted metal-binding membrane protein
VRKTVLKDIVGLILCIVGAIIAAPAAVGILIWAVNTVNGMVTDHFFPLLIIFAVGLTTSAIGDSMIEKSKDAVFRGGEKL